MKNIEIRQVRVPSTLWTKIHLADASRISFVYTNEILAVAKDTGNLTSKTSQNLVLEVPVVSSFNSFSKERNLTSAVLISPVISPKSFHYI